MFSTRASRESAAAANACVNQERGFDDKWLHYVLKISDEEHVHEIAKNYKHVIRKSKSMRESGMRFFPYLKVKMAA